MEYRGYTINECFYGGFEFSMQDGDVLHLAKTEQEAKREIDSILLERPHEVVFSGLTHTFQWLSDAVKFAVRTGGTLQDLFTNQFNAI